MKLGIGSYTFMWSIGFPGAEPENPMDAFGLLEMAIQLGVGTVQLGPNLPLSDLPDIDLDRFLNRARYEHIQIEMATRGMDPHHLRRQLTVAQRAGSKMLRTVPESEAGDPLTSPALKDHLENILPELERTQIQLTLENGTIPARLLADLLDRLDSPWIGITLDTVNSLAIPEGTDEVVGALARHTSCVHVKDFVVLREWHRMGFKVEGRPAGRGQLKLPAILQSLGQAGVSPLAILELWPPEQSRLGDTIGLEHAWARESIQYLRNYLAE
ncbi:MAG: sugar phosphate isomerase/epimerase [Candidatus Acidiferrum sp.]|jgi:sugar phosphate isomerase/epimerase